MEPQTRRNVLARLKRVEGQIGAVGRMVDQEDACVDILLQISAAQGALGKIGQIVLGTHIETCVSEAFQHGDDADRSEKVGELMEVFARYSRIGTR